MFEIICIIKLCYGFINAKGKVKVKKIKLTSRVSLIEEFNQSLDKLCKKGKLKNYFFIDYRLEKNRFKEKYPKIEQLTIEEENKWFDLFKIVRKYEMDVHLIYGYITPLHTLLLDNFKNAPDIYMSFQNIGNDFFRYHKDIIKNINNIYYKLGQGKLIHLELNIKDNFKECKSYLKKMLSLFGKNDVLMTSKFEDCIRYCCIYFVKKICSYYKKKFGGDYIIDYIFIKSLEKLVYDIFIQSKIFIDFPITTTKLNTMFDCSHIDNFLNNLYDYLKEECKEEINISKGAFIYYITDNLKR